MIRNPEDDGLSPSEAVLLTIANVIYQEERSVFREVKDRPTISFRSRGN
jgi:hypothetical protein